jgi:hypothetical protein
MKNAKVSTSQIMASALTTTEHFHYLKCDCDGPVRKRWAISFSSTDGGANANAGARRNLRKKLSHVGERECDTAFGRRVAPTCEVHENCAAGTAPSRPRIVVEDDNNVVDGVGAEQRFSACWVGELNRSIVVAISRVVAPAVVSLHRGDRQDGAGALNAIVAIKDAKNVPGADWGCAVAFAFEGAGAAAAQGAARCAPAK